MTSVDFLEYPNVEIKYLGIDSVFDSYFRIMGTVLMKDKYTGAAKRRIRFESKPYNSLESITQQGLDDFINEMKSWVIKNS